MKVLERLLLVVIIFLFILLGGLILFPDEMTDLENDLHAMVESGQSLKGSVENINFTDLIGNGQAVFSTEESSTGESGDAYAFSADANPYYAMLDENGQSLYKQLYANAAALNAGFGVRNDVSADELQTIFQAMYYDHPELFWLDNTYSYQYDAESGKVLTVTLSFNETAADIDAAREAFDASAESILNGAAQLGSEYEKEKYVHDALIDRTEYDLNAPMNQSAYSLLVNHRTVCAGYARAFQYLMNQLGIETFYVVGTSQGQDHAWNIVKLNGNYYNVDVTWDDAASSADRYYFFNLADDEFNAYHERGGLSVNLPACTSQEYAHLEDGDIYRYYRFEPAG